MLITFFFIRIVNNVNNVITRKQCIMQRSVVLFSIFMKNKDRSFLCTLIFILMFFDDFQQFLVVFYGINVGLFSGFLIFSGFYVVSFLGYVCVFLFLAGFNMLNFGYFCVFIPVFNKLNFWLFLVILTKKRVQTKMKVFFSLKSRKMPQAAALYTTRYQE